MEGIKGSWFVVIPAAGLSRRMGKPKLLLPYRGGTVIGELLQRLQRPEIGGTVVVCRREDRELQEEVRKWGGIVEVRREDPPEMRESVEFGLGEIEERFHPGRGDGWILIPADHPQVSSEILLRMFEVWREEEPEVLVPIFQGKRGHPTFFRWEIAERVKEIPEDRGLNWLLREGGIVVRELEVEDRRVIEDLDTPEDYERLMREGRE